MALDGRTDGNGQNYIPPPLAGDNNYLRKQFLAGPQPRFSLKIKQEDCP